MSAITRILHAKPVLKPEGGTRHAVRSRRPRQPRLSQLQVSALRSECIVDTCRVRGERPAACGKGRDRGTVPPRGRRGGLSRGAPCRIAPFPRPWHRATCRIRGARPVMCEGLI